MQQGIINWTGLSNVNVQPSMMDLFQSYMLGYSKDVLLSQRTKGVLFGGRISLLSGLTLQISQGVAVMPDGQLLSFPQQNITLDAGDASNPRIDRIEVMSTPTNNTHVLDINSQDKVLDIVFAGAASVVKGTAAATPTAPETRHSSFPASTLA